MMKNIYFLLIYFHLVSCLSKHRKIIEFSGYRWFVANFDQNGFYSPENAFVDSEGLLHMKIERNLTNQKLLGAHIWTVNKTGYGLYKWEIVNDLTLLNEKDDIFMGKSDYTRGAKLFNYRDARIEIYKPNNSMLYFQCALNAGRENFVGDVSKMPSTDYIITFQLNFTRNLYKFDFIPSCQNGSEIKNLTLIKTTENLINYKNSKSRLNIYSTECTKSEIRSLEIEGDIVQPAGNETALISLRRRGNIKVDDETELIFKSFEFKPHHN